MRVYAGATYLVPSGPNEKMHLHVVLVDPNKSGITLWVSICSIKDGIYNNNSCEFVGGEHKSITGPSYVAYNFLSNVHTKHINKMVKLNHYRPKDDVSAQMLNDILRGLELTEEAPRGVKKSCLNWPDE